MDISMWINLYEKYIGKWSISENYRSFRSLFGVHPEIAEVIIMRYGCKYYLDHFKLLIVLHYLKVYASGDVSSLLFGLSRTTYRKILWETIDYLSSTICEIFLENRFNGKVANHGIFKDIALVIDGTDIPIERPNSNIDGSILKWKRKKYYSGREKDNMRSRYSLKYTIAVQITTGEICYLDGPVPGSMNDIRAVRESDFLVKLRTYNLDEPVLADKGYEGLPNVISPIKKKVNSVLTPEEEAYNEIIAGTRFIVECTLGRMKIFGVLSQRFRKGSSHIDKHKQIVTIIANITNMVLKREPLSYQENLLIF